MLQQKRLLFVLNPIAGGISKKSIKEQVITFCESNSIVAEFYETEGSHSDKVYLNMAIANNPPDAVIAIGGDGTVNEVGKALLYTKVPLGIIHGGSANGLATDLDIPAKPEEALQVIRKFTAKSIDILSINGHYCFHMSDIGFNARVCHRFAASALRGKAFYGWSALREFASFKPFSFEIETNYTVEAGEAFMMTITNSNKFGTNITINPFGVIDDGFFEIGIILPFPKILFLSIMKLLITGKIYESSYYKVFRCSEARIYNKNKELFHIDGEPVYLSDTLEIRMIPKSLRVLI